MPNVTIQGASLGNVDPQRAWGVYGDLKREVAKALAGIEELQITVDQTQVWLQADLDSRNGNTRLVAEIIDLFDKPGKGKPERTPEVCQKVAEVLESLLSTWAQQHLSRCRGVEVRIFRLSLDSDGYATSNL